MIFDCENADDQDRWQDYDILDVTRGVWLNDMPIMYLDADAGFYRVLLKDEGGEFLLMDVKGNTFKRCDWGKRRHPEHLPVDGIAWEERRGRIQVIPKASES